MYSNYIKTGLLFFCAVFVLQVSAQEAISVNKKVTFTKEVTATEATAEFLQKFNLDENNVFQSTTVNQDRSGMKHEKMQQYFNGIKVEFGTLIIHSRNNAVKSINGEVYNGLGVNLSPALSPQEAFEKATAYVGAQHYLWSNTAEAAAMNYSKPTGELVLLPEMDTYSGVLNLAYKFDIYATQPVSRGEVYVDAQNGNILFNNKIIKHANNEGREMLNNPANLVKRKETSAPFVVGSANTRYSGLQNIETRLETTGLFTLNDDTRSVFTRNAQNVPFGGGYINNFAEFTDTDNVWTLPGLDNAALDAHWGAMQSYDYWLNVHGRDGINGEGFSMRSYVHVNNPQGGGSWVNAAWNGSVMSYGDGNGGGFQPLTSIDICAHEIGHGVTQFANNLVYARESGALNEGYSDLWGAAIEFYAKGNGNDLAPNAETWQIGEEFVANGLGIRSMSNPNLFGDPDSYEGTNWRPTSTAGCATPSNANDQCGVHSNSGVLNFWFYTLVQGGSGTNDVFNAYNVAGIGMQKAEEIAYLVLRDYLTPNSTFLDTRNAAIDVALNLYGSNSPEVIATQDAFFAVNVGPAYVPLATDARLVSVTDPEIHCGLNTYSPRVRVENAGVTNAITSVDINYTINSGTVNTFTYNGNIPVGGIQEIDLPVITLTKGFHALSFSIVTANDGNATNNQEGFALRVNEIGTVEQVYGFETADDDLLTYADGVPQLWSRGTYSQAGSVFATTTLSGNVYATNLSGNYFQNTRSYLVTDCYDLNGVVNPTIQFDMAFDLEQDWDYVYMEYSTNGGNDWNVLGTATDPNWYNSDRTFASSGNTDCFTCIGSQWTGTDTTIQQYSYNLSAFNNESAIVFRFVLVTDQATNNEGAIVDNLVVTSVLSVGDVANNTAFSVYPNPSKGSFSIQANKNLGDVSVGIFDMNGRNLYAKDVNLTGTVNFDLDNLRSGLYILRVTGEDFVQSTKIIIE